MKVLILNSKEEMQTMYRFGADLEEELQQKTETIIYDQVNSDFSNIPELYDEDEKIVLFNHLSFKEGFAALTKHLPEFKNVKYLLSPYSSYSDLDLEVVKNLNIKYRNNAGANAKSVAQYAITTMFMLLTNIPQLGNAKQTPDGSILGEEFYEKSVGIIGMGQVGQVLVDFFNKVNVETKYFNRSEKPVEAQKVLLEEIFEQDIVFIAVDTNADTKTLLSQITGLIKPHNYIIDISARDNLYDKEQVIKMLTEGRFKGYALETDENHNMGIAAAGEKINACNFVSTPHIAWCTLEAETRTIRNYLNRALDILDGKADEIDFVVQNHITMGCLNRSFLI